MLSSIAPIGSLVSTIFGLVFTVIWAALGSRTFQRIQVLVSVIQNDQNIFMENKLAEVQHAGIILAMFLSVVKIVTGFCWCENNKKFHLSITSLLAVS